MQTPDGLRVHSQMDIGRAGLLPDLEIVIHVSSGCDMTGMAGTFVIIVRCRDN